MTEAADVLTSNCERTWTHHAAVPERDGRMRSAEPYRKRPARPSGPAQSRRGGSGGDSRRSCSRAGSADDSPAASGRRPRTHPRQPTFVRPPSRSDESQQVGGLGSWWRLPAGLSPAVWRLWSWTSAVRNQLCNMRAPDAFLSQPNSIKSNSIRSAALFFCWPV